jgi:hypothetical protein
MEAKCHDRWPDNSRSRTRSKEARMRRMFQNRVAHAVYFERDELEKLRAYARSKCMELSPWIRHITLHVASKSGVLTDPKERP